MKPFPAIAAALVLGATLALSFAPAAATGVARVTKSDGSQQVYPNVRIHISKRIQITIISADGEGSLVVDESACSYVGAIEHCLLIGVSLRQGGTTNPLALQTGTAWVNLTAAKQPLPLGAQPLPPYGILIALTTQIGTHISVSGTIDGGSM
jgi:hypothetical protein